MNHRAHWQLNPEVDFLNHGSFGAAPQAVLQQQREMQDALEHDPIEFLAIERQLEPKLDHVRRVLGDLVGAPADDLVFVRNSTDGVNAVMRSFSLSEGDEIIITDHGYNACNNAARFVADRAGGTVRVAKVPFPIRHEDEVTAAIESQLTERTRLLLVDHVTSPTGLIFPIESIVQLAHSHGVRVLVDGAHAPGMVPLDVSKLDADYYTGNHHKWLCAPKTSGFLYVRPPLQSEVRPTVISHGANRPRPGRSKFQSEFDWIGTYDATPILAVPAALAVLRSLFPGGMDELMRRNHQLAIDARQRLCETLKIEAPSPPEMIGTLVSVPLPAQIASDDETAEAFQRKLYHEYRIEAPVFPGPEPDQWLLRISLQAYNDLGQVERLCDALSAQL